MSPRVVVVATAFALTAAVSMPANAGQQPSAGGGRQAVVLKQEAIAGFRQAGDLAAAANALLELNELHVAASDNRQALEACEQALLLYQQRNDTAGQARALSAMGSAYGRLSDYQKAIESYSRALPMVRAHGDRQAEAAALSGIGGARVRLNDYAAAKSILTDAVPLYQALGDRAGEAAALQSIGYASFSQDEYAAAIDVYTRALALARAAAARGVGASVVYNLGQVYYHLGDYQKALDLYSEALADHRALGNRSGEAAALSAIGRVYRFLGEFQKALDHHAQALAILRVIGERMNEATSLNNRGHVYLSMQRYQDALPLFQESLQICREVGNRSGEASNTNGIGLVHAGLGEYETALRFHREALQLFRAIGHRRAEADSLGHIGRAFSGLGTYTDARTYLQDALAIYRAVKVPRQESETLYSMAQTAARAGDLINASNDLDGAIRLAEGFRQDVSSQQLRTSYQSTLVDFYALKIDVLMRLHASRGETNHLRQAFEASERARARSLLDLLQEAGADIRGDVDLALLNRERDVRQRLAGRAERHTQLVNGNAPAPQLAALARDIESDLDEVQQVHALLRSNSPRYAALMQPEPLTLDAIQRDILDADTVLIEYFLGTERSYVWAVGRDSLSASQLPARSEIEAASRRYYETLTANKPSADVERFARALSEMLLGPIADRLAGKRLAVVADGALNYVPFGALPEPVKNAAPRPLIVGHEIVTLPSASTLAILRRESAGREPSERLVAVVADPVFDAGDVRLRRKPASPSDTEASSTRPNDSVRRSLENVTGSPAAWPLPRLIGTRREARAILSLAPERNRRAALDFDATRELVTRGDLEGYQIVHFATHALINNDHPELSGLVLSLVNATGRAQDGFLRLNDIYNLRLPADLVVLSACRTGLGKEMRGEGLVGLTRGFMYAGAPRVLTSLWQVDDAATSELMTRFYRAMLGGKQLSAAAALRQAQIEMWQQRDWQSPYYWAAFTLQGEWQQAATASGR